MLCEKKNLRVKKLFNAIFAKNICKIIISSNFILFLNFSCKNSIIFCGKNIVKKLPKTIKKI